MKKLSQQRAPIYESLKRYKTKRVVRFDVPGHKGGRRNKELTDFLGEDCLKMDVKELLNSEDE